MVLYICFIVFRLIIEGSGKTWKQDQKIRLQHIDTGGYLHSHDKKYSRIAGGQQEVRNCLDMKILYSPFKNILQDYRCVNNIFDAYCIYSSEPYKYSVDDLGTNYNFVKLDLAQKVQ